MKNKPVMLNSFQHLLITLLCGAVFCLVLTGCENFMKGSDIRKDLEEAITIANTSPVTYYVTTEEGAGTVTPDQFRAKKNETFDIQFKIADGWEFIQWEVLDRTTKEVVEDAVRFEDAKKTETKLTVLGFKENLEIHAKCSLIPMIVDASPKTQESVFANTPIVLTFNVPVEEDILDTLELTYKGQDFSSYFETPVFNDDKTILTVYPSTKALKQYIISRGMLNIDVEVKIGSGYIVKVGELELPLRENNNSSFKVKYKPESEVVAPSLNTAIASGQVLNIDSIDSLPSSQTLFSFQSLEDITTGENKNAKIMNNRTKGKVYIYGKYLEEGSGVKSIILTETRLRDKSGLEVNDDTLNPINYLSNSQYAQNIQLKTNSDGYTEFCIDYDLRSDDGAVLLNVSVIDACENTNVAQDINLTVFKDSYTDLSEVKLSNSQDNLTSISFDDKYFDENIMEVSTSFSKTVYGGCTVLPEQLSMWVDYYDAAGNKKHLSFTREGCSLVYYGFNYQIGEYEIPYTADRYSVVLEGFDNENIGGKSITMVVVDDIGNITEKTFTFPKKPIVGRIDKSQPYSSWEAKFYFSTFELGDLLFYKKVNGGNDSYWVKAGYEYLDRRGSELNYSYQTQFCKDSLYGPVSDAFDWNMEVDSIEPVELTDSISYSINSSPHYVNVTVNLPSDIWGSDGSNYDQIYFNSYWTSSSYPYPTKVFFTKPQTSVTFTYNVELLYQFGIKLTIYGIKGNAVSVGTTKNFDPPTSYEFDNVEPYLTTSIADSYQQYLKVFNTIEDYNSGTNKRLDDCASNILLFQAKDEQSGLDYFTIKPEGIDKSYKLDIDDYTFKDSNLLISYIPFWDMDETTVKTDYWGFKYSPCRVELYVYDKQKNSKSANINVLFYQIPKVIKVDKNVDPSYISFGQERLGKEYFNWHYTVYSLDYNNVSEQYEWNAIKTEKTVHSTGYEIITPFVLNSSLNDEGVYKIVVNAASIDSYSATDNAVKFGFSDPVYFCKGTCTASSSYILQKTKKAVLVTSDGPVYVHTLVTKHTLEECQNWDVEKWEHHRRQLGECKIIVPENAVFQKYDIPTDQMDDGDCYIVIAHFADGSTDVSDVMVK